MLLTTSFLGLPVQFPHAYLHRKETMHLAFVDWFIIVLYFLFSIAIGVVFSRRAGKGTQEYFLGGRQMPWYLAGLSMVATTFAADTPLAVTELVVMHGVSGNWLWWNMLIGGMLTVFFFSRLWYRAGITTELELIELRYSGSAAGILRGFKSVYLGLIMNGLIIAWVNVALNTILSIFFGIPEEEVLPYTIAAMLITAAYSSLSGLWGVTVTDAVQFIIAMAGCIALAVLVLESDAVGGLNGLALKLPPETFQFFPSFQHGDANPGTLAISIGAFFAFIGIQWWASWYPGAEPGGGGYVAQRMMSTRSEKESFMATLFFQIAHYALRPWPWILVGLATIVLYPGLHDPKQGYVLAMRDYLPQGWKGLLLVAFFAAYMSTIATQLNWGASFLLNDGYRRFIKKPDSFQSGELAEKHYVFAARMITLIIMVFGIILTGFIKSIAGVWEFIIECGAGLGMVLILRWFWWRINAWSELSATLAPFLFFALGKFFLEPALGSDFTNQKGTYLLTVGGTTLTWLLVTFLTKPESPRVLNEFYRRIRPMGFWDFRNQGQRNPENKRFPGLIIAWISSIILTYSVLFGFGSILLPSGTSPLIWFFSALVSLACLVLSIRAFRLFSDGEKDPL